MGPMCPMGPMGPMGPMDSMGYMGRMSSMRPHGLDLFFEATWGLDWAVQGLGNANR